MLVKDMRHETAMRPEPLSGHHIGHAFLLLGHIAYMIPTCIHDHVFIGLLKTAVKFISRQHINTGQ